MKTFKIYAAFLKTTVILTVTAATEKPQSHKQKLPNIYYDNSNSVPYEMWHQNYITSKADVTDGNKMGKRKKLLPKIH